MNNYKLISLILGLVVMGAAQAGTLAASPEALIQARHWRNDPWIYRYVLFVDSERDAKYSLKSAKLNNALDERDDQGNVYLDGVALFTSPNILASTGSATLAINLVVFDTKGHVITQDPLLSGFSGKITVIDRLVLVRDKSKDEKPYYLAEWAQGVPGDVTFSPAVCTSLDDHRYGPRWKRGGPLGDFGCREWTAQLNHYWELPYIDVTTYTSRGNFIGQFVGWARFADARRPVIGMHGKNWLCLLECPDGEQPGVIPDIRAWTRQHNFPMPRRPKRQPEYPNSLYKDDFNEFGD